MSQESAIDQSKLPFWKRTHYLDRMTLKELGIAYFQHYTIMAYLSIAAVCIAVYAFNPAPLLPTLGAIAAAVAVYPLVWHMLHQYVLHGQWMYKWKMLSPTWKRIHYDHHQDPNNLNVLFGALHTTVPTIAMATIPVGWLIGGIGDYATTNAPLVVQASSGVLTNDTDRDNDGLTALLVSGPSHGTIELNTDGSFVYTPTTDYVGPDSFTYRATDGKDASAIAAVSLFASQTAPVQATFQQGTAGYTGVVDTMVRGSNPNTTYDKYTDLTVDSVSPTGSTYSVQSLVQFNNLFGSGPNQIPYGSTIVSATLTFQTTDPGSGGDLHRMLTPWSGNSTWSSLVNGVQIDDTEAQAAIDAHIGPVTANGPISADVSATVQAWANGQANDGWVLTPTADDGWFFASSETTSGPKLSVVYVAPGDNRAPIATADTYGTGKNDALVVSSAAGVLANDKDFDGDALTAKLVSGPMHGSLQLNADGSFTYTPDAGYLGTDSFIYTANDAQSASALTTVDLSVGTLTQFTVTFKQGQNGYTATTDTMLRQDAPGTRSGTSTALKVDTDDPNGTLHASQALLRFDNLFGTGTSQVPVGAHIVSATLSLQTTDTGSGGEFHRMLQAWDNNSTWNTLVNGIQADGTEAAAHSDASTGLVGSTGTTLVNVTSSVQAWADGEANNGWAILPLGPDGWSFQSTENSAPPTLSVVYELYV